MAEMHVPTLPSLRGPIHEQEALDAERDIIHALSYPQSRFDFYVFLQLHRQQIEDVRITTLSDLTSSRTDISIYK